MIHTILEHCLVILSLYLRQVRCSYCNSLENLGTNLRRRVVIHDKCKGLARNIRYPDIVEHLGVIKRNFAGDYEVRVTRMRGQQRTRH